jgi:hypothetical protein
LIEYDPNLNPANLKNYQHRYRAFMASGIAYWGVTE